MRRPWYSGSVNIVSKYEIIIYWSDDDQAFIAEVPELPGCMAEKHARILEFDLNMVYI